MKNKNIKEISHSHAPHYFTAVAKDNGGLESASQILAKVFVVATDTTAAVPLSKQDDFVVLQFSSPAVVSAGAGNDTYLLSPSLLPAGLDIALSDTQGSNSIQLAHGLAIAGSKLTSDALQLTLDNGSVINVFGANAFTYEVGGNSSAGINPTGVSFADFALNTLGVALPTGNTVVSGGAVVINALYGTAGNDNLVGTSAAELIDGLAGDDTINGSGGEDTLKGGDGNDNIYASASNETIDGGNGFDYLNYGSANSAVTVDLSNGTATGGSGNDTIYNIEEVMGSQFDDTLIGSADTDFLYGAYGNDSLVGGAGNDRLYGGVGNDILDGGRVMILPIIRVFKSPPTWRQVSPTRGMVASMS